MEFSLSIQTWLNTLSESDRNFIGSECKRRRCMFAELAAAMRLYNNYILDWKKEDLMRLRRDLHGIMLYVVDYAIWRN